MILLTQDDTLHWCHDSIQCVLCYQPPCYCTLRPQPQDISDFCRILFRFPNGHPKLLVWGQRNPRLTVTYLSTRLLPRRHGGWRLMKLLPLLLASLMHLLGRHGSTWVVWQSKYPKWCKSWNFETTSKPCTYGHRDRNDGSSAVAVWTPFLDFSHPCLGNCC